MIDTAIEASMGKRTFAVATLEVSSVRQVIEEQITISNTTTGSGSSTLMMMICQK